MRLLNFISGRAPATGKAKLVWRIAMKNESFALLIISVPVFGTVSSRAMCIYSEGPERVNPGNGDTLDSLYVSFDPGFFHHQYSWQMSIGSSLDYHCVTAEGMDVYL